MSRSWLCIGMLLVSLAADAIGQEARIADPMRPATRGPDASGIAGQRGALRLEGIVFSASRRLALIDGEFLKEGDSLFGLRVERIEQNQVTVRTASRTIVLRPETAPPEEAETAGEPE